MKQRFPWRLALWYVFWVVLVFGLDAFIRHHNLYYIIRHIDKIMHFLGGVAAGTFAWIFIEWLYPSISRMQKFFLVAGCALVVGVGWEILERFFALLNPHIMKFDLVDTVTDVLSGILGGIISFIYRII